MSSKSKDAVHFLISKSRKQQDKAWYVHAILCLSLRQTFGKASKRHPQPDDALLFGVPVHLQPWQTWENAIAS